MLFNICGCELEFLIPSVEESRSVVLGSAIKKLVRLWDTIPCVGLHEMKDNLLSDIKND